MKPRIDQRPMSPGPTVEQSRSYRPSADDLISGSKLSRSELSLFALLTGAVGMTFVEHAKVLHSFMEDLPEFATVIAGLLRNVV